MIEVRGLTRHYGGFVAVEDVSFAVGEGEILGMLGPNGAGKTTTIRMITGFLPPTGGEVVVAGRSLTRDSLAARREIGYLPENVALYPEMRVGELLAYRARLHGLRGQTARRAVADHLERCLLDDVVDQVIGTLSRGYRQRVGLAAAILHDPKVLVLDEPTVGLDPAQIVDIRELIRNLGKRRTVLLSTHILPEVELLCDRIQIIDRGRLVAQGTPESLSEQWLGNPSLRVVLAAEPAAADAATWLERLDGVLTVRQVDGVKGAEVELAVECGRGLDLRADVFRTAVERGWTLLGLRSASVSLEDVFVRLTREEEPPNAGGAGELSAAAGEGEEVAS